MADTYYDFTAEEVKDALTAQGHRVMERVDDDQATIWMCPVCHCSFSEPKCGYGCDAPMQGFR